jgi:hypothetical protein
MARLSFSPKWGIRIFALWSLILAILAAAHLLVLSAAAETVYVEAAIPIWIVSGLNFLFALGFGVCVVGLWQHRNWARIMFLGLIVFWSGFNFANLLVSSGLRTSGYPLLLSGLRYGVALLIPWLYFNLPKIKLEFSDKTSNEGVITYDTTS